MLTWMREKFGPLMIGLIIGFIAFVFVFYGVFNPKATRGLHEGAVAGTVNGEPISIQEFNRELSRRMEYLKQMTGGKLSEDQMRAFRLRDMVFSEIANRKLMAQAALASGMVASDEEVRDRIREMPVFQKDGKFDTDTYRRVLEANNYSPAQFERMMRDDITLQQWNRYFKDRVKVSEDEIKQEFLVSGDKRDIKYVLLTSETGRKGILVTPEEIKKFLADPAKQNLAKGQFEQRKDKDFKGKNFDAVKDQIAREIIASEKTDEIRKTNEKLADQVLPMLTAEKSSDARVAAVLKPYGVEVKTTGMFSRQASHIPGIGEARDLLADAFAKKSPIDPKQGGKAKRYNSATWYLVALLVNSQSPDLTKLDASREQLASQISMRKEREMFESWMKKLAAKAKIDKNPSVVNDQADKES